MQESTPIVHLNVRLVSNKNAMTYQKLLAWLFGRTSSFESERNYAEECRNRPRLTDDQFLSTFYPSSEMRKDVPLRVRRMFAEQFNFDKIVPSDRPGDILQDIDLQIILDELAEEFSISLNVAELPNNDGSIDSIVRLVNSKLA